MTRNEVLRRKRQPCWLVGLMLVGSVFTGVACGGNVAGDVDTENGGGGGGEGGGDGGVEGEVDTEIEGGEGEDE